MVKFWKVLMVLLVIGLAFYYVVAPAFEAYEGKAPFGSSSSDHYISVKGEKPQDAKVKAYATFYGGGDGCKAFSLSAVDGKKRLGGKSTFLVEHNFAEKKGRYELRIPYKSYDSNECDMKLHRIVIDAENDFDPVGFAELRISQPLFDKDEVVAFDLVIDAKNCNAEVWQWANKKGWSGATVCSFFVDGELKTKEPESNAYSIHQEFKSFSDDTVIQYNIFAGENYRTEPLKPKAIND
ncbi:hypothetical protein [Vibrio owensii]|uniref:Uncharacterized protein n=1 Tax=Vibrio owensii CAIM 1854 = LMG 25443 TaxID=1229493 RepID=A0A0C1ZBS0_9VIBR|nr:hypothetical protein [Vibrio owensii]KIF53529.1 hypothetical protein H735_08340 [Vibrio owensii CAIM 1854 = LMG 25443]